MRISKLLAALMLLAALATIASTQAFAYDEFEADFATCTQGNDQAAVVAACSRLIDNAAKYMGDQPEPRIEIGAYAHDGETVCYVRDNGIGIDGRYHEKVFELFDQLDQTFEGSGVGLALVKRIVEIHDGRIWVESDGPGTGSCFFFALPSKSRLDVSVVKTPGKS